LENNAAAAKETLPVRNARRDQPAEPVRGYSGGIAEALTD
jgi:hypothetical protein